jgi:hypothetical protein
MRMPSGMRTGSVSIVSCSARVDRFLSAMIAIAQIMRITQLSCSQSFMITNIDRSGTKFGSLRIASACTVSTAWAFGRTHTDQIACTTTTAASSEPRLQTNSFG